MAICLFGIALGFNASMLDPFIYSEKVRLLAPAALKNSLLGGLTIMALLVALLAQPIVGRWSDNTRTRWGRRAPYLAAGVVGVGLSLALVVVAQDLLVLLIAALLLSAFANTTQVAWQALIPDEVPASQHGSAAGIKTIMELIGVVAGVTVVGLMLARGNLAATPMMTAGLFVIILAVTLFALARYPAGATSTPAVASPQTSLGTLVRAVRHAPPAFLWWILNRFLFWSAAIAIRTFLLNYLQDVMGMTVADAQSLSSHVFIILGGGVFLLALPAGAIADRIGRRPILIAAGLMATAGAALFLLFPSIVMLYASGGLIGGGAGIYASASWALATDLAPASEGALYLGLANSATVLGSMGGRLGGPLIDGINWLLGTVTLGYLVVFGISTLFFSLSSLVAVKITEREKHHEPTLAA